MPRLIHTTDVLEATYQLAPGDLEWLRQLLVILKKIRPVRRLGPRAGAFRFHAGPSGEGFRTWDYVVDNAADELLVAMRNLHASMSPEGVAIRFRQYPVICATLSQRGLPVSAQQHQVGMVDYLGLQVTDVTGSGCCFIFELPSQQSLRPNQVAHWHAVLRHIGCVLRLRGGLMSREFWTKAEAVIDMAEPGGRIQHAQGPATAAAARELLRHVALATDRLRMRRNRQDNEAAVATWPDLVAGRWTFVDGNE